MKKRLLVLAGACGLLPVLSGCVPGIIWACKRPEVTAISLNPHDGHCCGKESGIPFYLPKPLLIVAKNFRNIEEAKVGLTDTAPIPVGYDDQAKYADLNSRTNFNGLNGNLVAGGASEAKDGASNNTGTAVKSTPVLHSAGAPLTPGTAPSDGLAPATFYTYQIVFVPDMTQKYGLKIRGGPGEIRAAMNLVNGWQFTGIGPFYIKDSSTAQNILASGISARLGGQAAADILNASADLARMAGGLQGAAVAADSQPIQRLSKTIEDLPKDRTPMTLPNFAEIHVYEPFLTCEGAMEWREIVHLCFNRDYLGKEKITADMAPPKAPAPSGGVGLQSRAVGAGPAPIDPSVARAAVAGVFGLPADTPALRAAPGGLQAGGVAAPAGGVNQIQVDCDGGGCGKAKEFNLFRFDGWCKSKEKPRPVIQNRIVTVDPALIVGAPAAPTPAAPAAERPTRTGLESGAILGSPPSIINQPIFNQPGFAPPAAAPAPKPEAAPPPKPEESGPPKKAPPQ